MDDVVQTALLNLLRSYRTCQARSEAEVRAWIHAIGRREVASLFRDESRFSRVRATLTIGPSEWTAEHELDVEERPVIRRLRFAIRPLRTDQHLLLWMRLQERATWPEIGRELGITPAGAKRRYQRLVARLRRRLEGGDPAG